MKIINLAILPVLSAVLFFGSQVSADGGGTSYRMEAKGAHLIRYLSGPAIEEINGVPAIPVDSFDWSGQNIIDIKGYAKLRIDPVNNTGKITATWTDEYGRWSYHQEMFVAPSHPTGVKMGTSVNQTVKIIGDPVATNVYLHGDTGAGAPVIPTVFNLLATWGPAKITLNDEPFTNTFDGAPIWTGHTMISEGVRGNDGAVRSISGEIYSLTKRAEGVTYPEELTFHLMFSSLPTVQITGNIPPVEKFFYHVSFSDVKLKIKH